MSGLERWEGRFAASHYVFGTAPDGFAHRQAASLARRFEVPSVADGERRNGVTALVDLVTRG